MRTFRRIVYGLGQWSFFGFGHGPIGWLSFKASVASRASRLHHHSCACSSSSGAPPSSTNTTIASVRSISSMANNDGDSYSHNNNDENCVHAYFRDHHHPRHRDPFFHLHGGHHHQHPLHPHHPHHPHHLDHHFHHPQHGPLSAHMRPPIDMDAAAATTTTVGVPAMLALMPAPVDSAVATTPLATWHEHLPQRYQFDHPHEQFQQEHHQQQQQQQENEYEEFQDARGDAYGGRRASWSKHGYQRHRRSHHGQGAHFRCGPRGCSYSRDGRTSSSSSSSSSASRCSSSSAYLAYPSAMFLAYCADQVSRSFSTTTSTSSSSSSTSCHSGLPFPPFARFFSSSSHSSSSSSSGSHFARPMCPLSRAVSAAASAFFPPSALLSPSAPSHSSSVHIVEVADDEADVADNAALSASVAADSNSADSVAAIGAPLDALSFDSPLANAHARASSSTLPIRPIVLDEARLTRAFDGPLARASRPTTRSMPRDHAAPSEGAQSRVRLSAPVEAAPLAPEPLPVVVADPLPVVRPVDSVHVRARADRDEEKNNDHVSAARVTERFFAEAMEDPDMACADDMSALDSVQPGAPEPDAAATVWHDVQSAFVVDTLHTFDAHTHMPSSLPAVHVVRGKEVVYAGQMLGMLQHGFGAMLYGNGDRYEGEWHHGLAHGKGRMVFAADQSVYEGAFMHGQLDGHGIFEDRTRREVYIGEWQTNARHGHGRVYDDVWHLLLFDGQWQNNQRHGYGMLFAIVESAVPGSPYAKAAVTASASASASAAVTPLPSSPSSAVRVASTPESVSPTSSTAPSSPQSSPSSSAFATTPAGSPSLSPIDAQHQVLHARRVPVARPRRSSRGVSVQSAGAASTTTTTTRISVLLYSGEWQNGQMHGNGTWFGHNRYWQGHWHGGAPVFLRCFSAHTHELLREESFANGVLVHIRPIMRSERSPAHVAHVAPALAHA